MSRVPRVHLSSPVNFKNNSEIILDAVSSNYVLNVLRLQIGNFLILFDGDSDGEFNATIAAITNKKAIIKVENFISQNKESPLIIHLAQGISRGEKMDYTIQKAVELGVYSIKPLFTEYCNVNLSGDRLKNRMEHWQRVAISACEQSGRCIVPKVLPAQNIDDWLKSQIQGKRIVLDHRSDHVFKDIEKYDLYSKQSGIPVRRTQSKHEEHTFCICNDCESKRNNAENPRSTSIPIAEVTLIVGPEGGLSSEEMRNIKENNFQGIKMGPRVLRTETAALVAISVLQNLYGDI